MTTTETKEAIRIIGLLRAADLKTTDYRGRQEAIAGLTDKMMTAYKDGDYQGFYGWAKEINGEFKRLREPVQDAERGVRDWEVGSEHR